jgi:hypothetical protein
MKRSVSLKLLFHIHKIYEILSFWEFADSKYFEHSLLNDKLHLITIQHIYCYNNKNKYMYECK